MNIRQSVWAVSAFVLLSGLTMIFQPDYQPESVRTVAQAQQFPAQLAAIRVNVVGDQLIHHCSNTNSIDCGHKSQQAVYREMEDNLQQALQQSLAEAALFQRQGEAWRLEAQWQDFQSTQGVSSSAQATILYRLVRQQDGAVLFERSIKSSATTFGWTLFGGTMHNLNDARNQAVANNIRKLLRALTESQQR